MSGPPYEWDRTIAEKAQREEELRISRTAFPVPESKTLPLLKFCEYANALRELPVSKYARLYIRRWKPILLPEDKIDERSGLSRETFPSEKILTISKDNVPLSERYIMSEIGVGDYTIRLNDNRQPFERATVVHCEKFATPRDWDMYPPVLDLRRLDWDEPDNQVYIKWGISRGHFKRPNGDEQEQSDMAQATVVETLTNDVRAERARTDQLQQEARERAEREAKEAKDALARAQATPAKQPEPVKPTTDLEAMGGVIVSLVNAVKPTPDTSLTEYLKLEAVREESRRQKEAAERKETSDRAAAERARADQLQAEILADLRAKATAPPPVPAVVAPPPTLAQQFTELETLMATAKRIARGGRTEEEAADKPSSVDKWLEASQYIGPVVQQFFGGIFETAKYGLKIWGEKSYNEALAKNGNPQTATAMTTDSKPAPKKPEDPPLTAEQQAHQQAWNTVMSGVLKLAPHIIRYVKKEKTGAELALFVINHADNERADYERIRQMAKTLRSLGIQLPVVQDEVADFVNAARFVFQQVPALWKEVGDLEIMGQFLSDFYNYDEILAKAQEDEER